MGRLVRLGLVFLVAASPAVAGAAPRPSSVRAEVTVERVQVDVIVLPGGDDPRSCREVGPEDLVARVAGENWDVEAIDWEESGLRGERSRRAGDACLQLAVYLGAYAPAVPLDCPWDPHMREGAPFEPPSGGMHPSWGADIALAARRIVDGLGDCDRVTFYRKRSSSTMIHTTWIRGRERARAVLAAILSGRTSDPGVRADILVQPWSGGWEPIVAALGATPGHKDLVVIDGDDLAHFTGEDPWRLADLAETARKARVTIHRVDPVGEGRVSVPGTGDALATGGLVIRGGARARVTEEIRRRAWCRARVTLVPPAGARRERYRSVAVASRTGGFEVVGTSWLVDRQVHRDEELASYVGAGEGDRGLAVRVEGVGNCASPGGKRDVTCEVRVLVRPSGPVPVEPAAAGVALWNGSRTEFSRVYGLVAGGDLEFARRIRLPFTSRRGRRTLCVFVFDRAGTYLGSGCRGIVVPPATRTAAVAARPVASTR